MRSEDRHRPDITRRSAMATMTTLATGFALAVRPVSAETITTDTEGLLAGEVRIPTRDIEIPAYRAAPKAGGPFPVDIVGDLKAPVLGLYGGDDSGIPNDLVARMQEKLRAAEKPSEIVLYPDTPHGFHADYRPSYRKEQAEDGWRNMLAWFKKYGV